MFKGIQKTTLVDFPGRIAATLFTGGCNFRCPWCHNYDLVEPSRVADTPDLPTDEVLSFLESRKGRLDGVCVTGGEPTLWGDELIDFFENTREMGYENKLDTNGYLPNVLESIIEQGVLNFIAMDIKTVPSKYDLATGLKGIDFTRIKKSVFIIKNSGLEYEFRTTMVPNIVTAEDIEKITDLIGEKPTLQDYREPLKAL